MRNLKILGLAFVAVLAMSAVASASASAAQFMSEGNVSGSITADQEAGNNHVFSVDGTEVKCTTAHFATMGLIASPTEQITVHPEYSGCTAFGFVGAEVNTSGCDYVLHASGSIDVVQGASTPTCNGISVHAATCTVVVGTQNGLSSVSYENLANGTVRIKANVTGIKVNKTEDGFLCPLSGTGAGTGTYTGNTLAEGKNAGGVKVPITWEP
jgi:hypothetical protein